MYWKRFLVRLVVFSVSLFLFFSLSSIVKAGCLPNATCLGTTVVDIEAGCRTIGSTGYCNQAYFYNNLIHCDANCFYNVPVTGYACCSYRLCSKGADYCTVNHSGSCCSGCIPSWGGCSAGCGPGTQSDGCGNTQACNNGPCSTPTPTPTSAPTPTPTPTPTPAPLSCFLILSAIPASIPIGAQSSLTATTTVTNGTVLRVDFTSNNGDVSGLPAMDSTPGDGFTAIVTGVSSGNSTITATATMNDNVTTCTDTANITVGNKPAWWQVKDADVSTNGDLNVAVP